MGDNAEIYERLRGIEQTLARIDERTKASADHHDDHEKRISDQEIRLRALEAHRARMEEAIPDIRNDLRDMKGMLNAVLLRLGGGQAP